MSARASRVARRAIGRHSSDEEEEIADVNAAPPQENPPSDDDGPPSDDDSSSDDDVPDDQDDAQDGAHAHGDEVDLKHDFTPARGVKLDFSDHAIGKLAAALKPVQKEKLSRSLLPKLNYTKQIIVSQGTFASWVEQVKVYTYSRRWPVWCFAVGGLKTWDGVDKDDDESIARREAYEWMETSIPESSKYILIFVRKGDAKAVYEALWKRFASLTVKELQQKFWSLEMKSDQQIDHFAHVVNNAAINLKHAGVEVPDVQIATAFIQGLNKSFALVKEKYRNVKMVVFTDVVQDATNFAIDNKLLNTNTSSSPVAKTKPLDGTVMTMCKFWRMKKGCFKKEKCPLAKYHTDDTRGKGWNSDSVHAAVDQPSSKQKGDQRKCYSCNKTGHLRKDCPDKNSKSKSKANENKKKNDNEVSNLNLNFMMISPVSASVYASFDLKSHWILDSGATEHICSSTALVSAGSLSALTPPAHLTVGNGQVLHASQQGTVHFNDVSFSGVLVCEQCPVNIISEGKLLEKGLTINKTLTGGCQIKSGKKVIMTAKLQNKLMFVDKAMLSTTLADVRRFR
jgi:hypothetical protein